MIGTERAASVMLNGDQFSIYPGVSQYEGRHWLKRGMRLLYNVDYIHAWIGFSLGGIPLVYHSTGFGVHVAGWESLQKERVIKHMWEVHLGKSMFPKFARECFRETGKRYSNRQLFGTAIVKALGLIGINLKELPFGRNKESEHVCSETAGRMLFEYTDLKWHTKDPDLYTPKDFYDSCRLLENRDLAKVLV